MNPKGVPTKGMWIKVFVKALPNQISPLNLRLKRKALHYFYIDDFFLNFVAVKPKTVI